MDAQTQSVDERSHPSVYLLENNYPLLHRQYRLGNTEGEVGFLRLKRPDPNRPELKFYEMCEVHPSGIKGTVTFRQAIDDFYHLIIYIEQDLPSIAQSNAVKLLRSKCLVYEATDYILKVPKQLGDYFEEFAEGFPSSAKDVEKIAEELKGGLFKTRDEGAKVIKLLLIAAVWGANQMYRRHNEPAYDRAFSVLQRVNNFIRNDLQAQHQPARKSFGIEGLAQYMTGRVLFRKGLIGDSRKAFRKSADAYLARLRQKEAYRLKKLISPEQYEEKIAVTIRRAALVAAFGDGYYYFVSGQLSRALESLTVARAALTGNAGRVYLIYVEMLYWASQRAAKSSNLEVIEECVRELGACRKSFGKLTPDSPYFHRTGIQLALALLCRAKLTALASGSDYEEGLRYLEDAHDYANQRAANRDFLNPSLLAAALIAKSRYFSFRYRDCVESSKPELGYDYLENAEIAAKQAHEVVPGMRMMQSEASAMLGEVFTDQAELALDQSSEKFRESFSAALDTLQSALAENGGQNLRNEAICLLRLTRLCLLSPHTEVAARDYFAKWKQIENQVEHDYCKTLAMELERKFNPRDFVIKITESLNVKGWGNKLEDLLIYEALKEFVAKDILHRRTPKALKHTLKLYLEQKLGYASTKINHLIKERDLLMKVSQMKMQSRETKAEGK